VRSFAYSIACEPISFVVAVNDWAELRYNLQSSQVWNSKRHEFLLVDNFKNESYVNISELYNDALHGASCDLIFFVHQDVFFPRRVGRTNCECLARYRKARSSMGRDRCSRDRLRRSLAWSLERSSRHFSARAAAEPRPIARRIVVGNASQSWPAFRHSASRFSLLWHGPLSHGTKARV